MSLPDHYDVIELPLNDIQQTVNDIVDTMGRFASDWQHDPMNAVYQKALVEIEAALSRLRCEQCEAWATVDGPNMKLCASCAAVMVPCYGGCAQNVAQGEAEYYKGKAYHAGCSHGA